MNSIPHLHLTPPTPAAVPDPAAFLKPDHQVDPDAVELPPRVGTEEVQVLFKELEEEGGLVADGGKKKKKRKGGGS